MRKPTNTIYIIRSSATNKVYIGQTWETPERRFSKHIGCARRDSQGSIKLRKAMRKYGTDTFTIEQIDECDSQEKANELEDYYILQYNSIESGLNLKRGGAHGEYSEESKKKMSESHMGELNFNYGLRGPGTTFYGGHHTDEAKAKISAAFTGEKHHFFGKIVSEEERKHLIEASAKARLVNAKITEQQAREIKQLLKTDMKHKNIALLYNISKHIVSSISRGIAWGWVE